MTVKIHTYKKDGRLSYKSLYGKFDKLLDKGWKKEKIYEIIGRDAKNQKVKLACYAYISPNAKNTRRKDALWVLSGVHGEEPAGPNALAQSINSLIRLAKNGVHVVAIPLLNPLGYIKDYRYYDSKRHKKEKPAHSVTDAEHLLPDLQNAKKLRRQKASNKYARMVFDWVAKNVEKYPPKLVFDHHEDEIDPNEKENINSGYTYSYCYGDPQITNKITKTITNLLIKKGFPIQKVGKTWFDEIITDGFVHNSKDGSIDEYLSYRGAKACFVVETTRDDTKPIPLKRRVQVHKEIIKNYKKFWLLLK